MLKRIIAICLTLCITTGLLAGCGKEQVASTDKIDISTINNTTSLYAGVDDLGRTLDAINGGDSTKEVGIFYFPWVGTMGIENIYDVLTIF